MRLLTSLLTATALLLATSFTGGGPAHANPPDVGYSGAIIYENGERADVRLEATKNHLRFGRCK